MVVVIATAVLVFGFSTTLGVIAGGVRALAGLAHRAVLRMRRAVRRPAGLHVDPAAERSRTDALSPGDVAVLVAAHNEEMVIAHTIRSALSLVPPGNVFVVSDGSSDDTVRIAREAGATVVDLQPNRGKAGALAAGIRHFDLANRFEVVMFLDADTQLTPDYFTTGLPQFADPRVVAVAGRAATLADPQPANLAGRVLVAYRERVYVATQYLQKYGQAASLLNAVAIVPGFASMYRARILERIDIDPTGLVIEDFNMTFEVHAKRLGRISFRPGAAVALTQDPDTFDDYVKQVRRWSLGFWQTVRRHGAHVGVFWTVLFAHIVELVVSSVVVIALIPAILVSLGAAILVLNGLVVGGPAAWILAYAPPHVLAAGLLIPDFLVTVFAATVMRRPRYLLLGLLFPPMRVVDAFICLGSLRRAATSTSSGVWQSPSRREVSAVAHAAAPAPGT